MFASVLVGAGGAVLAGMMLCAGFAKMAVPAHLSRTIGELLPAARTRAVLLTRLIAATEIGTALALSMPATRGAGAVAGAILGVVFTTSGMVAAIRRLGSPCGCFGRAGARPLGVRNAIFGLLVVALSALLFQDGSGGWAGAEGLPMLGTAAVAVALAGWVYRDMIKDLGQPIRSYGRRSAMRSTG